MKLSTLLSICFSGIIFSNVALAVPTQSESIPKQSSTQTTPKQTTSPTTPLTAEKNVTQVNINSASAEELAKTLTGIGLNKAKKIVEYREKMGPFVSVEQLKEVSGIGQATLDKNAGKIAL